MEVIHLKAGEKVAKRKDKVSAWYIVQEGTVTLCHEFEETTLGPNSIIGILEQDWFICDYEANSDVTLYVFPCEGVNDLKQFLTAEPKMRKIFLRSALLQRHQMFCAYADMYHKIRQFLTSADHMYEEYSYLCARNKVEAKPSLDVESIVPLEMQHKAENWEINSSNSLIRGKLDAYLKLMETDEDLCIGAIMEASAQMHRIARGIREMSVFLRNNRDALVSEIRNDLFHASLELQSAVKAQGADDGEIKKLIEEQLLCAEQLGIYTEELLETCKKEYASNTEKKSAKEQVCQTDLEYILQYAGYENEKFETMRDLFVSYEKVKDADNKDEEAYRLRKQVRKVFYELYWDCFMQAMEHKKKITPVMEMFFNFAYIDQGYLGEDKTSELYQLSAHLDMCVSEHVFTIFSWLQAVYEGKKEPSKNEFDMDYTAYLTDGLRRGEWTKDEIERMKLDQKAKTKYELENMFVSVNRVTYGNITMFSPLLTEKDLFNSLDKMLVTAERLEDAFNAVRKVDYSLFYRPMFPQQTTGDLLKNEMIMKEILPDVILMPNAGTRAMMWQETASVRNDTPARFMVPIFTAVDLQEAILENCGRYRWEMCRKIQGVRWNDLREHSLTSDYYDYLQFYRKNRELSAETKDQIKGALSRAKNNFREVFVKDYQNWIKYEAKGGFRLNRYVRQIMFTYCPFAKLYRADLRGNPMFADSISRFETNNARSYKRLHGLYEKYKREGGEMTPELRENLNFYQM